MIMQKIKTYLTKPSTISIENFNPRFYEPNFLFVKNNLEKCTNLEIYLEEPPKGGTTPPYYLFKDFKDKEIPYVKTSAISRDFINLNDLHYIHPDFHYKTLKRSIAKPNDVVFSMTGKFMGKAALVPKIIDELNMSQNSVVLKTDSKYKSAYLALFLNSEINKIQIQGLYTISKQKYLNQGKISGLKIIPYKDSLQPILEKYLKGIDLYYEAYNLFKKAVKTINDYFDIPEDITKVKKTFTQSANILEHKLFTPEYYCSDYRDILNIVKEKSVSCKTLDAFTNSYKVGDEIGSANYLFEGIPFIKTSDCINFNIDYQPNYYCTPGLFHSLGQDVQFSDIILAKDGKIGEIALVTDDSNFVFSGGLVKVQSGDLNTQLLLFAILSSMVGQVQLKMWTVIASTMAHLRTTNFFKECIIPELPKEISTKVLEFCHKGINLRKESSKLIKDSKEKINDYFLSFS